MEEKDKINEELQKEDSLDEYNESSNNSGNAKEIIAGIGIAFGALLGIVLVTLIILLICGYQFYYVLTGSMSPTIYKGEMVLVSTNFDKYNLKVGDIITFSSNPQATPVTHRIIEVVYNEDGSVHHYMQGEDYKYRIEILGEKYEGIDADSLKTTVVTPEQIRGVVVQINDSPIKLVIIGAVVNMFQVSGMLDVVKIALVIAIIGLIIWSIISYVKNKKQSS